VDEKDMSSFRQGQTKRERERRDKRCASEVTDRCWAIARGRRTRMRRSESKKKQQVEEQGGRRRRGRSRC